VITEDDLRARMNYDDAHLPHLSGAVLADESRRRTIRRRRIIGSSVAAVAVLCMGVGGYSAWERRPHIVPAEIAYASGPTMTLPDGSIDTWGGKARAWIDSRGTVCWGNDATSLCTTPSDEAQAGLESPFATISSAKKPNAILGGLVHEPLKQVSFTTADGQKIPALAIQFRKFPGWTVVVASVPRGDDGRIPSPESLTFNGN
jgi:hypothetical protein